MSSIWVDLMGAEVKVYHGKYRTRVIEAGQGEPLILLHGVGGHAETYSRNIMRLSQHFRVMSIDLLWHGYSQRDGFVPGRQMELYSDQVVDLLDQVGAEKGHIEGESLGGWVGLTMAMEHPGRVDKLVLNTTIGVAFNPGTIKEDQGGGRGLLASRSMAAIQDPNRDTIRQRLEWLMASPERVTDELVDVRLKIYSDPAAKESLTNVFANSFGQGVSSRRYSEEDLSQIKAPTLVLWSDKNPGTGPDVGEHLATLIPDARCYVMKDAAHWPQWEHAEEHDRVVTGFLQDGG